MVSALVTDGRDACSKKQSKGPYKEQNTKNRIKNEQNEYNKVNHFFVLCCYAMILGKLDATLPLGAVFFVEAGGMAPEAGHRDGWKTGNKCPG